MRKTILVVDDEPSVRKLVRFMLEEAGYDVDEAADGTEALEHVRGDHTDLCVLDLMMPRMSGQEVLRTWRDDPATTDLPVVILTARGDPSDRLRGWELGCDAYVPKPFEPSDVVREVAAVLARSPDERKALRERQMTVIRSMSNKYRGVG